MTDPVEPGPFEPTKVSELRGNEGGQWVVQTQRSRHIFDLEAQTVTRYPGVDAQPSINDVTRRLRSIETCVVGKRGYWLMEPDHYLLDHYYQISSRIVSITRIPSSRHAAMSELIEYVGPWAGSGIVQEYLGIDSDELTRRLSQREILGCEFLSGTYFPINQFVNRRVVAGLHEVLEILASGDDDSETWATWMAGRPDDHGLTNWELLRDGQLDRVLTEARRDANRWSQ